MGEFVGCVCSPEPTHTTKMILRCPTCKVNTWFSVQFYEWYEADCICMECGEEIVGNEILQRPFKRGWREANKKRAKARLVEDIEPK